MSSTLTQAVVNLHDRVGHVEKGVGLIEDRLHEMSESLKIELLKDIYQNSTLTRFDDEGRMSTGDLLHCIRVHQIKDRH